MSSRRQDLSTSMFSPSSARIAASTAKDWSFINSWLFKILPNESLPNYERNPATLTALLTLASVNEATTGDRDLLSTASNLALVEVAEIELASAKRAMPHAQNALSPQNLILHRVTDYLTREGQVALGALADTSVQHKVYPPRPEELGMELVNLRTSLCETEQMVTRVNALNEHLLGELQRSEEQLAIFEAAVNSLPPEVPKQNLELQRKTSLKAKHMSDARERQTNPAPIPPSSYSVDIVLKEEKQLLNLLASRKILGSQVSLLRKLPNDAEKAKDELEGLQRQLRELMVHRDLVFEGLVEQASPLKYR
ncbi:hypothetical protein E4U53_004291 [Claviceps sorghi]|nr:hypothetical protein E4U53_004291 [Claviceps sorghi]